MPDIMLNSKDRFKTFQKEVAPGQVILSTGPHTYIFVHNVLGAM